MPNSYLTKARRDILRGALQKLQKETSVTAIGPGSVARSLAEVVTNELGDFYSIMDFNIAMGFISSAQGRALDLLGELYDVQRKELSSVASLGQSVGSFYFYIDSPYGSDIVIPQGTKVAMDVDNYIGDSYSYRTESTVTIPTGRTRTYASLVPEFNDSVFTAGEGTLVVHDFSSPVGTTVKCTNPKTIAPQVGRESDRNYRNRIIKAVRTSAGGTTEAIRFTGLSVPGVREVRMRPAQFGLGTVEALVVPEDRGSARTVVSNAISAMEAVRPAGVRLITREPDYVTCDLNATVVVEKGVGINSGAVARRVEVAILRYLNTLLPGDTLIYSRLIDASLDASDAIKDITFSKMRISGREVLRRNYKPETDEQIVPGSIKVVAA